VVSQLKVLDLNNNDTLEDEGLAAIVNGLRLGGAALEILDLNSCKAGSKTGIALGEYMGTAGAARRLKHLDLGKQKGPAGPNGGAAVLGDADMAVIINGFAASRTPVMKSGGGHTFWGVHAAGPVSVRARVIWTHLVSPTSYQSLIYANVRRLYIYIYPNRAGRSAGDLAACARFEWHCGERAKRVAVSELHFR
jgi:hypothetical protein